MKDIMFKKILFISLVLPLLTNNLVYVQAGNAAKTSSQKMLSDQDIIKQAWPLIKQAIEKNSSEEGEVARVTFKLRLQDQMPVETSVKTYFNEYHKTPDYAVISTLAQANPNSIVEVSLKAENSQELVIVRKNAKNKLLAQATFPVPEQISI
jgi:hypothetical protein